MICFGDNLAMTPMFALSWHTRLNLQPPQENLPWEIHNFRSSRAPVLNSKEEKKQALDMNA